MAIDFFPPRELVCGCGCGRYNAEPELVARLNAARVIAGIPLLVTSGCRCPTHNAAVGGSPSSSHLLGRAADIAAIDSGTRWLVLNALLAAGFTRLEVGGSWIHADVDHNKQERVIWLPPV